MFCENCKTKKLNKNNKTGLCSKCKAFTGWDKRYQAERHIRRYEKNYGQIRERNDIWRKENKEKWNAQCKAWRQANPKRNKEIEKGFRTRHPEKGKIDGSRRRAKLANAPGNHDKLDREAVFDFYGWRCCECAVDLLSLISRNRTIDHIIPLSLGGSNGIENLRPLCRTCNSRKGVRLLK